MDRSSSFPFETIVARGSVRETDLTQLREHFASGRRVSREDAEGLFAVHARCPAKDTGWSNWFIATVCDYIVHSAEPEGYVTHENANWLIQQITRNGRVETRTELDLLIAVLESARWAPRNLIAFGLMQVRQAVTEGGGPMRPGQPVVPGQLFDEEIEIVRRMIYAFGGEGCFALTREEAEVLFDINDALDATRVNTAWAELFVKAVANVMLAASGYRVPTREEALRSEAWVEERGEMKPADVVKGIVQTGLDSVFGAYREQNRVEQTLSRLEVEYRDIITGDTPTPDNAKWLTARFQREEGLSVNELALIDYLKGIPLTVEPALQEVFDRVRPAA